MKKYLEICKVSRNSHAGSILDPTKDAQQGGKTREEPCGENHRQYLSILFLVLFSTDQPLPGEWE